MKTLLRREKGATMVFVLAFMALSIPMITAALGLASTLSIDSRIKTGLLKSQYTTIGGLEHAIDTAVNDPNGDIDSLPEGGSLEYTTEINGEEVTITIVKVTDPPEWGPSPADNSRRLQTVKTVTPESAMPNESETYAYTVVVENRDDESEGLTKIHDILPTGFSYVSGSSKFGHSEEDLSPIANPSISGQQLTWNLGGMGITLQPAESRMLTFQATATVDTGNYCNEAWVEPGQLKTSTGKTARVQVGWPSNELCTGAAVTVRKQVTSAVHRSNGTQYDPPNMVPGHAPVRFTYEITIYNHGSAVLSMKKVRDLLPLGFSYVSGSTSGFTTADPTVAYPGSLGGRARLDWDFSTAKRVLPGETWTLRFDADAQVAPADYWNEVWVTFTQFSDPIYTWPTAKIAVMGVLTAQSTNGSTTATAEVWVGTDSYRIVKGDLN